MWILKIKPDQHTSGSLLQTGCLSWSYSDIKIIFHKCATLDIMAERSMQKQKNSYKKKNNADSLLTGKCILGKKEKNPTEKLYS